MSNHTTMLLMKKQFHEAIRTGQKTTTLRYWKRLMVKPGSVHTIPRVGKVRIEAVDAVELDELTEDDARCDGMESLAAIRQGLKEFYDDTARRERTLYRIRFTYLPDETDAPSPSQ
jgi:hypothetical protein